MSDYRAAQEAKPAMRSVLSTDRVQLWHGDASDIATVVAPESVDSMVTDPPAGIAFMGKTWDGDKGGREQWIAWLAGILRTALVLLKPGGHALVWSLPRTQHWTMTAIEDAGFQVREVIVHLFGTGFPKSLDVSKAIDESRAGLAFDEIRDYLRSVITASGVTHARIRGALGYPDNSGVVSHWIGRSQPGVPSWRDWQIMKPLLGLDARFDELIRSAERDVVGTKRSGIANPDEDDRHTIGAGSSVDVDVTVASTPEAARFAGVGTALKPGHEAWVLARKPLVGTVAANALRFGTGGLRIDDCRIGGEKPPRGIRTTALGAMNDDAWQPRPVMAADSLGRWPANVTLSEAAAQELDEMSGVLTGRGNAVPSTSSPSGNVSMSGDNTAHECGVKYTHDTGGGASRFFYCPKGSRAEKDTGLEHLPMRTGGEATDREEGSAALNSPRTGAGRGGGVRNHHPTVKSVDLMRWLCRLVTPRGGTVLDLFAGSGTTGVAAVAEGLRFVGVELDAAYADVAAGRIAHAACEPTPTPTAGSEDEQPVAPPRQRSLFDALAPAVPVAPRNAGPATTGRGSGKSHGDADGGTP